MEKEKGALVWVSVVSLTLIGVYRERTAFIVYESGFGVEI